MQRASLNEASARLQNALIIWLHDITLESKEARIIHIKTSANKIIY